MVLVNRQLVLVNRQLVLELINSKKTGEVALVQLALCVWCGMCGVSVGDEVPCSF